jgi:hypothetical protein
MGQVTLISSVLEPTAKSSTQKKRTTNITILELLIICKSGIYKKRGERWWKSFLGKKDVSAQ